MLALVRRVRQRPPPDASSPSRPPPPIRFPSRPSEAARFLLALVDCACGVAWEATYTMFVSSCCWCIIRLVPNVFIIAAVVMVVEMLVCQAPLLWTGSSMMRGEGSGGPSQLVGFLQEPVTSDTPTLVTRLVKELVFGQIFGYLAFGSMGFLFIKFNWPLPTDVLIAIIIWVLLIPLGTYPPLVCEHFPGASCV